MFVFCAHLELISLNTGSQHCPYCVVLWAFLPPGTWCPNRDDRRWFAELAHTSSYFPGTTENNKLQAICFSHLLYFTDARSVFADKIQVAWIMLNDWYLAELLSSSLTLWSKGIRDFPLIKPLHSGIQLNHMGRADKLSKNNVCEARLSAFKSKGRSKTPPALQMRAEDQDKPTILGCEISTLVRKETNTAPDWFSILIKYYGIPSFFISMS